MNNYGTPSAFFKGLKEDQQSSKVQSNAKNITMLRCLRWVMKKYGMCIEVQRANVLASTLMSLQLVKYDKDEQIIDTGLDISIQDTRIEKGLFELEHKTMQFADLEPMNGLETILSLLRKNEIKLPPHDDLRNEIIMKHHTVRIGYMGKDPITGEDLFSGFLILNDEIVVGTEPQKRMGYVLDNLENALFAKRRENYRKSIGELMLKLSNADNSSK